MSLLEYSAHIKQSGTKHSSFSYFPKRRECSTENITQVICYFRNSECELTRDIELARLLGVLVDSAYEAENLQLTLRDPGHVDVILVVQRFATNLKEMFNGLCKF